LFYYLSRFLIRLALPLFVRKLCVVNKSEVPHQKPVLLASNHSGSFFDALVIGAVLTQPMHTLARGDVFRKPKVARWLRRIKLIPVFRGSEGRENLKQIDSTMQECFTIMKQNGTVVIFSEGICVNEWHLRPLGKGTARMAHQAWYGDEPLLHQLAVVPTGVNHEHFRGANKRVILQFGETIRPDEIQTDPTEYEKWLREFNALLTQRMQGLLLEIPSDVAEEARLAALESYFADCGLPKGNSILNVLGKVGRLIHRPLHLLYVKRVAKATQRTVFYDSVLFGSLTYTYPVIIGLLALLAGSLFGFAYGLGIFIGFPLLAMAGNRYRG
jgi:1-acyl-sn-glycerol-3-phosphate acyltransferase